VIFWQVFPRCAGSQDPQDSIQHGTSVAVRSFFAVGTPRFGKHFAHDFPLDIGQIHAVVRERNRSELFLLLA
jgi:hypothetical protein